MARVIVVYESKYGNTKLVAETIVEGIKEVGGVETTLVKVKEVDFDKILDHDVILIGSPNHIGGPTRSVRRFIDKLGKLDPKGKRTAVFDTYLGKDFEKAVKKMEKRINKSVPSLKLVSSGLSIKVKGMKGPISDGELPKCRDFGRRIVAEIGTSQVILNCNPPYGIGVRTSERLIETLSQGKTTYIDLGKTKTPPSREFYQASYGIEGF